MKTVLLLSTILSWINLVVGSYLFLSGLYGALSVHDMKILMIVVVFIGAIILHSYAALQLRKSILHPEKPLSRETPVGIRFIGFLALFCSLSLVASGTFLLQNLKDIALQPMPFDTKNLDLKAILPVVGVFILVFGITIALNVIINFRLLKWYFAFNRDR
jgi:hypothetical protein